MGVGALMRTMTLQRCSHGAQIGMDNSALAPKCPQEKPTTICLGFAHTISPSFKFHVAKSMPLSLQVSLLQYIEILVKAICCRHF